MAKASSQEKELVYMYICSIPFTLVSMPRATGKNGKKLAKASNKPGEARARRVTSSRSQR
jgi:hypothetical protein